MMILVKEFCNYIQMLHVENFFFVILKLHISRNLLNLLYLFSNKFFYIRSAYSIPYTQMKSK